MILLIDRHGMADYPRCGKKVVSRSETDLKNIWVFHIYGGVQKGTQEKDANLNSTMSGNKIS